ncbi:UbiA family prenyltransferase, partial [Oleiphilus sp. HI0066]
MKTTVSVSTSSASASWKDYLELCKPKVVALMLLTSVVGMLLATYSLPSWEALILGNLGIALMAGSAAAINHVVDQRIDVHMSRTKKRPIVQGKVDSASALIFAALIGSIGMLVL